MIGEREGQGEREGERWTDRGERERERRNNQIITLDDLKEIQRRKRERIHVE